LDMVELVTRFINGTSGHIFLTGKAGTGKTTFLRMLANRTHKNFIVVAPTGIAALNAGGVTIHSQFLLPPGTYLPERELSSGMIAQPGVHSQSDLARRHPLNQIRKGVLRSIDLLVIDEVSMLRADLLDAIDYRLKAAKGNYRIPFGGAQLLLIGDLYQLPPVVKREEDIIMKRYYPSPWFFESRALKSAGFVFVELDKIYRQQDDVFIQLLNNLRNNITTQDDLQLLNKSFKSPDEIKGLKDVVTLTTHNFKADELNQQALKELTTPSFFYDAIIDGDFLDHQAPVLKRMELKVGTQIMFIKNDNESSMYFNGKLATVVSLNNEDVVVELSGTQTQYTLRRETWVNRKYMINEQTKELEEEVIGEFVQFPIRLAWAITVHKSQGLTFERAIIDVGQAFADGQVYVALSRLRSLDGLILRSRINPNVISTDKDVVIFSNENHKPEILHVTLLEGQKKYLREMLILTFDFEDILRQLYALKKEYELSLADSEESMQDVATVIINAFHGEIENTKKFRGQILSLLESSENEKLFDRLNKGSEYYVDFIVANLRKLLQHMAELSNAKRVKTYLTDLNEIDQAISKKWMEILKISTLAKSILSGENLTSVSDLTNKIKAKRQSLLMEMEVFRIASKSALKVKKKKDSSETKKEKKKKKEKTGMSETVVESLKLLRSGKSIAEIAAVRSFTEGTIESHLQKAVELGELNVADCMEAPMVDAIRSIWKNVDSEKPLTEIYAAHDGKYTYNQLRMVRSEMQREVKV